VVFVLDDPARVQRAYWGAYGIAKAGLLGLMRVLHDETDTGPCACSAAAGPMRTEHPQPRLRRGSRPRACRRRALRPRLRAPAVAAGAAWRGEVWRAPSGRVTTLSAALLLFLILDPLGQHPGRSSACSSRWRRRGAAIVLARELLIALGVLWPSCGAASRARGDAPAPGVGVDRRRHRAVPDRHEDDLPEPGGMFGEPRASPSSCRMAIPMIAGPSAWPR
jgi:hypothetical protein